MPDDSESSAPKSGAPEAPPGASLENIANNLSRENRNRRYNRRTGLWGVTTMPRCRACGRRVRTANGEVDIRLTDGVAGFAGLVTCGSVWVCPVCSSKIMARRALEIGRVVAGASVEGLSVGFLTLTMRHHSRQRLEPLWAALSKSWETTIGGKMWVRTVDEFGIIGWVRVVEVTLGENGWHVHVHALVIGEGWTPNRVDELGRGMWERWARSLQRCGLAAPVPQASEWHLVTGDMTGTAMGEYLAKGAAGAGAIGMELTQTQSKVARAVHSTHSTWELLDDAITAETAPLQLWHEWERASKGRRQIGWSRGLRERFGIGQEQSDEELAAEELSNESHTVVVITRAGWDQLIRRPVLLPDVLTMAEQQGQDGLSKWLWDQGVDHRRV